MVYTEATHTSWGSRLGGAFKGILAGIVMIALGTIMLYWNEGRTVKTGGAINEARSVAVGAGDISRPDPGLEGKVIYAVGRADTQDVLEDPIFGAKATAIKIAREVEYYQWTEHSKQEKRKKLGGGEETVTTYTYRREWVDSPVDSNRFRDAEYQMRNKVLAQYKNETLYAPNVTFGAYKLPDFLKRAIGGRVPLEIKLDDEKKKELFEGLATSYKPVESIPVSAETLSTDTASADTAASVVQDRPQDRYVYAQGNVLYLGKNPGSPEVGDVRVSFTQIPPAEVSIIAQVLGNTFEKFTASNGYTFSRLEMGRAGTEKMFAGAESENTMMAWILRIVGTLVVVAGLGAVLRPLSV
ncbi:MAG: TMEM43 family protein, partial [Fretibacterium sp.]|nr:TMEM43 family protein [Fretibacterium sp.]